MLGLLSLSLPATAAFDVGGLQAALSGLLAIDMATAGWLIGGALTFTLILMGIILASKLEATSPIPLLFLTSMGMALSVGFGWWPIWPIFVSVVIALLGVLGLFAPAKG